MSDPTQLAQAMQQRQVGIGGIAGAAINPNIVGMPPGMNPPVAPSAPLFPQPQYNQAQQPQPSPGQPPQHQVYPVLNVEDLLKFNDTKYVQFLIRHATRSVRTILIMGNVIDFQTINVKVINSLYIDTDGI